ncbi:hypothetical protein QTN25_006357 [Entamoeba marina]
MLPSTSLSNKNQFFVVVPPVSIPLVNRQTQNDIIYLNDIMLRSNAQILLSLFKSDILRIVCDDTLNYILFKMLEYDEQIRISLCEILAFEIKSICNEEIGCIFMLNFLECLNQQDLLLFLPMFEREWCLLVTNKSGHKVVVKYLKQLENKTLFVHSLSFNPNITICATNVFGCRFLQESLQFCSKNTIQDIISCFIQDIIYFSSHKYGNYLIQEFVTRASEPLIIQIAEKFKGRVIKMSTNKHGSNVIEKLVELKNKKAQQILFEEILSTNEQLFLLQNHYGNYVIQSILSSCDELYLQIFSEWLRPYSSQIKKLPYSKNIQSKLIKTATPKIRMQ